ncbi:hypothetical protein ABIE44_000079 [Marmoricola sp. OAE513]|uniref:type IV toxin-antitoxin system AbiEi family antitoxin domain-containing protein n=1 Tax=Marmoricola sp. OAE513 TaxID=2817894 RepID=UPI001AE2F6CC
MDALDLGVPFTPAGAARAGLGRSALDRMVRIGAVTRLVRGVYVASSAELTPVVRAEAVALVSSRRHLVVGRTAAWVHGAPALRARPHDPVPLDLDGRRRYPGAKVPLRPDEVTELGGLRLTSPLRTAYDVARQLAPERALPLLDGLLRVGALTHAELIARTAEGPEVAGGAQARELAAIADGRAAGIEESVLRLHWLHARLPTPTPGWRVAGVRCALALPVHRFGVVLAGQTSAQDVARCQHVGWQLLAIGPERIRSSDPSAAAGHLVRAFHGHLLSQMR